MNTPEDEMPNIDEIRKLAAITKPPHIILKDVRCIYGSEFPSAMPEDYCIIIDYDETEDAPPEGTFAAIEAFQAWSHPLIQDIRSEWSPDTIRITFRRQALFARQKE